jgi:uncharacterized membrane protein SpoIIM required for sporulation
MLEFLINPKKAEKRPWEMFFIGLFYSIVSLLLVDFVFLKNSIFANYTSIMIIFFTVLLCVPFVFYLFLYEERKEFKIKKERKILEEHGKAIAALMFLFLGMLIGFSLSVLIFPSTARTNFEMQIHAYCNINMQYDIKSCFDYLSEGKLVPQAAKGNYIERFFGIFVNNLYVLFFVIIFSLIFGVGAIFILTWNASVIAIAIANLARVKNFGLAFSHYMLHGIPEITAYFVAGLAGGIISMAVIRHDYKSKEFWIVLQDSVDLIILSIIILLLSAFIEVFLSPFVL